MYNAKEMIMIGKFLAYMEAIDNSPTLQKTLKDYIDDEVLNLEIGLLSNDLDISKDKVEKMIANYGLKETRDSLNGAWQFKMKMAAIFED